MIKPPLIFKMATQIKAILKFSNFDNFYVFVLILTLKMPRKPASENVVSLSSAEYSCKLFKPILAYSVDPDQVCRNDF